MPQQSIILICANPIPINDRDNLVRLIDEELKGVAELIPLDRFEKEQGSAPRIRVASQEMSNPNYRSAFQRLQEMGYHQADGEKNS